MLENFKALTNIYLNIVDDAIEFKDLRSMDDAKTVFISHLFTYRSDAFVSNNLIMLYSIITRHFYLY